jgi:hypothetical protein
MTFPRFLAALPVLALAACVPKPAATPAPTPTPAPAPTPTPVATPSPVPTFTSWMDFPATPGDWTYAGDTAVFGLPQQPRLWLRCDRSSGTVQIANFGNPSESMTIRTEFMDRSIQTVIIGSPRVPSSREPGRNNGGVPANDPLLDAMAFSKGRFAVEVAGGETLYIPSYPEVTRVIEDCR